MKIDLRTNEKLIREGAANLQRGAETVGGRLFLTDQRLYFESHAINLQTGATEIPLPAIKGMELCWTKFLNLFPLFPNSLVVHTVSGDANRFVLFGRKQWAVAIAAQQQIARAA